MESGAHNRPEYLIVEHLFRAAYTAPTIPRIATMVEKTKIAFLFRVTLPGER